MRAVARGRAGGPPPLTLATVFVLLTSSAQLSEVSPVMRGDLAPQQQPGDVPTTEEAVRPAKEASVLDTNQNGSFVFSNTSAEFPVRAGRRRTFGSGLQRQGRDICSQTPSSFKQFAQHFKTCLNISVSGSLKPGSILQSCFNKYWQAYGSRLPPRPVIHPVGKGKAFQIFHQRDFTDVCLPLFRQYGICKEGRYSTFCMEDWTLFLHTRWCQRPSEEDKYFEVLWAVSLMRNDYECFDHICDGSYRVIVREVSGIVVQLLLLDHIRKACKYLYKDDEIKEAIKSEFNKTIVWTKNMFFSSCYPYYEVTWLGLPEEKGLNRFWDYLPLSCRVGEIVMATSVAFIGVFGAVGNLLVVTVILRGDRRSEESSILRTSLAFADLFTSVFVVIPAFHDHLLPIMGHLDFNENSATFHTATSSSALVSFHHHEAVTHGYHLFQGLVFGVCSFVSLLTLFLLSVERFILTGRAHRYQHYFTVPRVKIAVFLTWSLAIMDTLFYMYNGDGLFSVTWSSFNKLPVSVSNEKIGGVLRWTYSIHIFVLSVLCVLTVITSLVSIGTFVQEQAKVVAGWKKRNMRVSGPYQKENRQILTTMCILTFLFMLSTLPVGAFIVMNLTGTFFVQEDLFRYLGWWTFLSGCSWNPWVYNMRSRQFRQEVGEVLRAMLPQWLRRWAQRPEAAERQREKRRAQLRMLRKLDLIE